MAYINEFGETIACNLTFSDKLAFFLSSWYSNFLPIVLAFGLYFIFRKKIKSKKIRLIILPIILIILSILWILMSFNSVQCD